MHYTVEEIRSLRNNYLEAPYPGFSLEEITRRRRGPQTKLVRGENAWQAKGTAQTTEEWVQRLVQGSLNKMSPVNFNLIMERLKTKELFTTPEILKVVVTIVFQKALDEPENSSLYAQVCYHLATFEVSLQESGSERPNSELRNAIVAVAQEEFKDFDIDAAVGKASELCEEDQEFVRSNFMRRKRANMRFVGGLYLNGVLGSSAMLSIADATMRVKKDGHPKMEIVELLVELLTTVGERLDEQQRKHMDGLFRTLSSYREADSPYPPRIRFKLMDLIDLRNRSWKAKPTPIATTGSSTTTTTTTAANSRGKSGAAASPTTAKKSKSFADALAETNSKAAGGAWRDAKGRTGAAAPNPGAVGRFAGMQGGVSANSTNHAAAAPSAAAAKPASPPVPLGLRVVAMLESWVAECSNDFIPEWSDQFDQCEQFSDMDTFCGAVAMEAVRYACTTTRKDAQREAYSFLVVGLYLRDSEVLAGFSGALAAAIEEGLLEDVPKFSERFMHMLRLTSTEEVTSVDVYFDAANVLRMAYARMTEVDEYTVESMMGFWSKLSAPPECSGEEEAEEVEMGATVLLDLIAPAEEKEGVELLLAQVLRSLEKMAIVNAAVVEELREMEEAQTCGMCMRVLAAYDALVAKGE